MGGDTQDTQNGSNGNSRYGKSHDGNDRPSVFLSNNFERYWRSKVGESRQNEEPYDQMLDQKEEEKRKRSHKQSSPHTKTPDLPSTSVFSNLERSQTVDRFVTICTNRLGGAMSSGKLSKAWKNSQGGGFPWFLTDYSLESNNILQSDHINSDDYAAERNMIQPHLTPLIWGSGCMVITFFSFRMGRWYQGSRYTSKTLGSSVNKTSSRGATHNIKSLQDALRAQRNPNNPFDHSKEKAMASLSTLPVDAALSILCGISTTLFLMTPGILMKDLSNSPLLEGRSVLVEELCLPLREEMENMKQASYITYDTNASNDVSERNVLPYSEIWKDENLQDFYSLRALRDFVTNCREREEIAKQIADSNGEIISAQEAMEVKIDPPGIKPESAAWSD